MQSYTILILVLYQYIKTVNIVLYIKTLMLMLLMYITLYVIHAL